MFRDRFAAGLLQERRSLTNPKKRGSGAFKKTGGLWLYCAHTTNSYLRRLKKVLDGIIHRDQWYCFPDRSIMDNLFLMRDLFDV